MGPRQRDESDGRARATSGCCIPAKGLAADRLSWRDVMSTYRRYVTGLGILAAIVLFSMENPWYRPEDISDTVRAAATIVFWVLFIGVIVLMFSDRKNAGAT